MNQSGHLTGGGFEVTGSQSLYVQRELEEQFPDQGASPLALVAAPRADASFADMDAAVAHLERLAGRGAQRQGGARTRSSRRRSRTGPTSSRCSWTSTTPARSTSPSNCARRSASTATSPVRSPNGKVKLYVIGQGALGAAATAATKHDIAQAEQWNLPIVLIVLLAVFGSLAAAAMPLVLGICTVVVTMGLVYLLSMFTTMSVFVTSTVSMFGIALAIDYSLFILMRFREELRAGREPDQAADAAMATSGLAVVLSGLTVIASVTGIYLINTPVLQSMATGAILAVGRRRADVDDADPRRAGDVRARGGQAVVAAALVAAARDHAVAVLDPLDRWVMRRPWLSALAATVLLLTLAAPAFSMVLGNSMQRQFDPTHEIRGGVNAAAEALGPGALGPVRVLVTFPDGNAASAPAKEPLAGRASRSEMSQAPNVVSVARRCSATTIAARCSRRCSRWIPRTWRPGRPSTGCGRELPPVAGDTARRSTSAARPR